MQKTSRRAFLRGLGTTAGGLVLVPELAKAAGSARRPNVILIMTDDQGYGDLGCHGNEHIKTPNLDRLHAESVRFDSFYVCPVCSPTRACLMTGRYNYRTGAIDTYLGRSMMHGDEVTVAEMLGAGGYQTAIFGKWHLGDNHPMRAVDQGFHESVVHRGGGLCQPSDWPGNTYFDPILSHNGHDQQYKGYCTDIYTDQAIRFIEARRDRPFFVCLSTNAPHTPLQIGDSYVQPYLDAGIDNETAKVYGVELRTTHKHGVEPSLDKQQRAEVKKRFDDSPVTLVGIGSNENFDSPLPPVLEKAIEATKAFVLLSHDVGGSGVKVKPNDLHKNVPREKTIEQIGTALNTLGAFGEDYGQQIRLEVHGGCSDLPTMKEIMDVADHPNVALCWNSNARDLEGQGLEYNFNLVKDRLGATTHVRTLDYPTTPSSS